MPDMTATIPHQLTRAEAKRRIQEHVNVIRQQHGMLFTHFQETWTADTMTFSLSVMGQSISGKLTVDDHAVYLTVALPWLLKMLAESIKPRIEQQGRLLLSHQTVSTSAR
ncbi:MAG TPA: polyhydroxyalkanoic acid system family protein [Gemmataceae bacterium]|nr:polyhydroxyalkanoic acid system family protein [Gemmataceae bacterium]